jgi:hypothetical protein
VSNLGKEFSLLFKGRKYVFIANTTTEANEWIAICNETRDMLSKKSVPKRETEVFSLVRIRLFMTYS